MLRTTCRYCEEEGRETQLVPVGHWGLCPIHSKEYLDAALEVARAKSASAD